MLRTPVSDVQLGGSFVPGNDVDLLAPAGRVLGKCSYISNNLVTESFGVHNSYLRF